MLWDGLIILLVLALSTAGWNVGIINSWRGPVAIIIATIATQLLYVDFAQWIVQQLQLTPEQAVGLGYILLWCALEIIAELALSVAVPLGTKNKPQFFERAAGAVLGLAKAIIIVILPMIALQAPIKVEAAPASGSKLFNPMELGLENAVGVKFFAGVAKAMYPTVGPLVASTKAPSFKPSFREKEASDNDDKEAK